MLRQELVFHGARALGWTLFCAVAIVASVALIVILMRDERRLVPRHIGTWLLSLRLLVVGLLLAILLEPVVAWTRKTDNARRVLVALDVSNSMDTCDAHATPAEKLRWARALNMLGNSAVDERLDRWQQAYDAGREPVWVDDEESSDAETRHQLGESRKQHLEQIFAEVEQLSRKEIARRLIAGTSNPLFERLEEIGDVEFALVAGKTDRIGIGELSQPLSSLPAKIAPDQSDLSQALADSDSTGGASPLAGIVLLTDGRDNAGSDPVAAAEQLSRSSIPVFGVLMGSEQDPTDVSIVSLDFPETTFQGDVALLEVTLATAGFEGQPLEIVLEEQSSDPISKTVVPKNATTTVTFELDAELVGRHEYTLRAKNQPRETITANNHKSFAMNVVDDKVRVLLLEGQPRWEFRFLHNALSRDERIVVENVVFRQPFLGVLKEPFFGQHFDWPNTDDEPDSTMLAEPDLIVVGDVSPDDVPEAGWRLLERFVADAGGTLVFIAGKRHMPLEFPSKVLERLLPVTNLRVRNISGLSGIGSPTERGFRVQLTPDGHEEPAFQLANDAAASRQRWDELPGHSWGIVGEAKPGATVLANAVEPDRDKPQQEQSQDAIFVQQQYGHGQVLWIGIDSTWRWRHRVGDELHHRFWGQLARRAADDKVAAGNEFVRFGPEQTDIVVGQEAVIRARWSPSFLENYPNLKASAAISQRVENDETQTLKTIELQSVTSRPLVYEARVDSLPVGEYQITLSLEGADVATDPISASLYVNPEPSREMSDLGTNRELLTRIADAGSGRVLLPDQLHQLPELLSGQSLQATSRREYELWNHWFVLLIFFVLLVSEWVIRKRYGLP